ncbi:MAG: hypothetical protein HC888_01715 [Candidatus Competibacteraceae bacterium]|nr:hypothetical protein [Candidatus Competibacteraceae bacterium]
MMSEEIELLKSELAYHGFRSLGDDQWDVLKGDGSISRVPTPSLLTLLTQEIAENKILYSELWRKTMDLLTGYHAGEACDDIEAKLFVASVKDLARTLELFEETDESSLARRVESVLNRDIASFSRKQIVALPEHKLAMQWVFRQINKLVYVRKLILSIHRKQDIRQHVKVASISGPWANLDLGMRERVWEWAEDDETFRAKDRSIRKQRRYTKGLENYNNDGRVGEGHYWRELRNEPFSWYDRSTEDPYHSRSTLSRWG